MPTRRITALTTLGFALCLCLPARAQAQAEPSPPAAASEPSAAPLPCSDCNQEPITPPPPVADASPAAATDSAPSQPATDAPAPNAPDAPPLPAPVASETQNSTVTTPPGVAPQSAAPATGAAPVAAPSAAPRFVDPQNPWSLVRCEVAPCFAPVAPRPVTAPTKDSGARRNESAASGASRFLGATLDLGVPDGVMAGIAGRPWSFARAQAAVGTNGISLGVRGGVTLRMPTQFSPSLTLEAGHYFDGNANALASKFAGSNYQDSPVASAIGYQFANMHAGLELGSATTVFFIHGGVSYIHAQLHHVGDALSPGNLGSDGATTVTVNSDPRLSLWTPSVKFGFLLYLV